jgi:hypothetical protein
MLGYLINGITFLVIACLVALQVDVDNSQLMLGWHGLLLVVIVCLGMAILNIAIFVGKTIRECSEYNEEARIQSVVAEQQAKLALGRCEGTAVSYGNVQ